MSGGVAPSRGDVLFSLGGKVYQLRPYFAAIDEVQTTLAMPWAAIYHGVRLRNVAYGARVLGALMRANNQKLTDEQVGQMLIDEGIVPSLDRIEALMKDISYGGSEPGEMGEAKATAETDTSPSVAMPAKQPHQES